MWSSSSRPASTWTGAATTWPRMRPASSRTSTTPSGGRRRKTSRRTRTLQDAVAALSWGKKGLLLAAACALATVFSPVLSYSCRTTDAGAVGCRVTRHALGFLPYWWTRIERVADADSTYVPGQINKRFSDGRRASTLSEVTNSIRAQGAPASQEWTTYAAIGADPGTIAIAIDALVAKSRSQPLLAWQSNGCVVFAVFILGLPMAAAMLSRPYCERFVERGRWLSVIQRVYVVTLCLGVAVGLVLFWGSVPEFLARPLGLPTG